MTQDSARIWCAVLVIMSAAGLIRGFLTGKIRLHITGDRSESPMTYWFLMAFYGATMGVSIYRGIVGFPDQ